MHTSLLELYSSYESNYSQTESKRNVDALSNLVD